MSAASSSSGAGFTSAMVGGFAWLDQIRRRQGEWLDQCGFAPLELVHRVILERPELRVRAYREPGSDGPVLLIVPAPIKRCYIWDLSPGHSVVRSALLAGLRVYMIEWLDREAGAQSGLDDYADRLIGEAIDAVLGETGPAPLALAGHSLGGTLAAIHAARHPSRLTSLVLVEAPLHFAADEGPFAALLAAAPDGPKQPLAQVPGSMLGLIGAFATPWTFVAERWFDAVSSGSDPENWATHGRVERWALDEFALPGQLFHEVVEGLYRADSFRRGRLRISGRAVGPRQFRTPTLAVIGEGGGLIEAQQMVEFLDASRCLDWQKSSYKGEVGVALQHVGPLVGAAAQKTLWPEIFAWLTEKAAKSG